MDRRTFVGALAAAGASAALPLDLPAARRAELGKIGVQLNTFRTMMAQSVERTLATVADIGYREVEFAGYQGRPPRALRQLLDRNGLSAPSAHVDTAMLKDKWLTTLNEAVEIGHKYLVVASLSAAESNTLDAIKRTGQLLNKAGQDAARYKITLCYHNHETDFRNVEGTRMYDALLAATDPKYLMLDLDLYGIYKGGSDPFDYFAKHPGRFPLLHAADIGPMPEGKMLRVGAGTIKWAEIFAKTKQAGIKHVFVSQDDSTDVVADTKASYKYLKALKF
jgi:sugar phosphate isomerase/epimerase